MRVLRKAVLAGGVVYPAGTPATEELDAIIKPKFWTGHAAPAHAANTAALDEIRRHAAAELADRDARIVELTTSVEGASAKLADAVADLAGSAAEVERLTTENADLREQLAAAAKNADVDPYKGWKASQLSTEIEKRNADRDPDGDRYIVPAGPGERPELLAALQADDARSADV